MSKAYILKGGSYMRYDVDADRVDLGNGRAYLFKRDRCLRIDRDTNAVDDEARSIAEGWGELDA